jgi:hypothetical protein
MVKIDELGGIDSNTQIFLQIIHIKFEKICMKYMRFIQIKQYRCLLIEMILEHLLGYDLGKKNHSLNYLLEID